MDTARSLYRWLTAVFAADIALQLALAGLGVFRARGGEPAHEQSVFDPHRVNGDIAILLALLLLLVAVAARNDRWRPALVLFVLTLVQNVLAQAGTVGGALHGLNAFLIVGFAAFLAHGAWAGKLRARRAS